MVLFVYFPNYDRDPKIMNIVNEQCRYPNYCCRPYMVINCKIALVYIAVFDQILSDELYEEMITTTKLLRIKNETYNLSEMTTVLGIWIIDPSEDLSSSWDHPRI